MENFLLFGFPFYKSIYLLKNRLRIQFFIGTAFSYIVITVQALSQYKVKLILSKAGRTNVK
ncbi:hypothetical protein HMPREF0556_10222 [Listeria grayi DSM 20601]|uniref:Uncharacterized protein n=1 Tax=Listeria grayi DSM 20601 TaxID=525367 RepID=D7UUU7_LISGR|nr:hypothetical protein HMPREF0556_10222 [Listeria grayi DSM 20601]